MRLILAAIAIALLALCVAPASAQNAPPPGTGAAVSDGQGNATTQQASETPIQDKQVTGSGENGKPKAYWTFKTPYEFWLTGLTIALLATALVVLTVMAWRSGFSIDYTRTFVIVVIIFAALFLIAAGYSDVQAAPVYALLGTITGYIFGRASPAPGTPPPADPTGTGAGQTAATPPVTGAEQPARGAAYPQ